LNQLANCNINKNEIFIQLASVRTVINSYLPKTAEAKKHLDRGVDFRYILIKDSVLLLHECIEKIHNNSYEMAKINIAFNSIYINIRGILDNLAWILRFDILSDAVNAKSISFTNPKFLKRLSDSGFNVAWVESFAAWMKNLSLLHDPIAHRLPLYIPPGIVTDPEVIQAAKTLCAQKLDNFDDHLDIQNKSSKLNKFQCVFIVDDAEKGISYPMEINEILIDDLENLVRFSTEFFCALTHWTSDTGTLKF
jgi:hypothetical protein